VEDLMPEPFTPQQMRQLVAISQRTGRPFTHPDNREEADLLLSPHRRGIKAAQTRQRRKGKNYLYWDNRKADWVWGPLTNQF
jgi:hypothetical protein